MRKRDVGLLAMISIVGSLLAACTNESDMQPSTAPPTTSGSSFTVATYIDGNSGGLQARIEGHLYAEDGCLYLESSEGRVLPVFPASAVSTGGQSVTVSAAEYGDGDSIVLSGAMTSNTEDGLSIPAHCGIDDVWVVSSQ